MSDDNTLGPPPVEAMSDVTWARVERGLWSRIDSGATDELPAPRRRWLWVAVPTLAVAAVVALLVGTGVFRSRGDVPVTAVVEPVEPSRVVAGASPSAVSFGDAHIELAAQSAIVMTREGDSPSVLLERGTATFAVAPRRDRAPFVVRAGDTVVRVVGTRFIVSRSEELITVTVEHGLVDVQFRGGSHRIGASQTWSSEVPDKIALRAGTPDTNPVTSRTLGTADANSVTSIISPTSGAETKRGTPDTRTGSDKVRAATSRTDTLTGTRDTHTAADSDRAKYDRLVAMERNDPSAALSGYLELSQGDSKWAGVALFAAGRLAADRQDRRAVTLLDIYLHRFPNGANAHDARNLLARLKGDAP